MFSGSIKIEKSPASLAGEKKIIFITVINLYELSLFGIYHSLIMVKWGKILRQLEMKTTTTTKYNNKKIHQNIPLKRVDNDDDDDDHVDNDEIYAKTTICHNNYNPIKQKKRKNRQIGRQTDFNIRNNTNRVDNTCNNKYCIKSIQVRVKVAKENCFPKVLRVQHRPQLKLNSKWKVPSDLYTNSCLKSFSIQSSQDNHDGDDNDDDDDKDHDDDRPH
ncbi:hypothetical protein FF38_08844 [Lucilia cuprina]|uniref:Uncharacterized protein n=1 Tax=Lucilia cuprina TaxID=7375 RepID=A0A0L0BR08_LUCCU|nr:hypothetical protein FF38_08844 [Lucilia cuprina]